MKKREGERLFPIKALVAGAVFYSIYAIIIFSLDPVWVAWAAPMVFGGALYVPDPPPPLFSSPQEAFQMASLCSLLSLLVLGLLMAIRGEPSFGWLARLKAALKNNILADFADSQSGLSSSRMLDARTLLSTDMGDSINAEVRKCEQFTAGQERVATLPHSCRAVSGGLEVGGPEDLQPLHGEAVSAESNDIL